MKKIFVEEEGEVPRSASDSDGRAERIRTLRKRGQGKKEKSARQKPSAEKDDVDLDLPEVVTMMEGRQEAQKLRKEERESERRIAAEAKRRRLDRTANKIIMQEDETTPHMLDAELKAEEQRHGQQQPQAEGLLDDSIVQFISEREKAGSDERKLDSALMKGQEKRKKRWKKVVPDRVQVILLDCNSPPVDQTAMEFKYNHLFGNRLKRDMSMLQNISKMPGL